MTRGRAWLAIVSGLATAGIPLTFGCGHSNAGGAPEGGAEVAMTRDQLLDPTTCGQCHQTQYMDWSVSMHAYASNDPVFLAMNRRGQRETDGGLGTFCVSCHAPMAVRDNMLDGGVDPSSLPQKYRGVTCFFCHSIESVDEAHPYNANVNLASDLVIRGEIPDPAPNAAHKSTYSRLHDRNSLDSAKLCGTCHDIQTPLGAHIERTYSEWRNSPYNASEDGGGSTCIQCHMFPAGIRPIFDGGTPRTFHLHDFPAVDVALDPTFPGAAHDRLGVQSALNGGALRGALCVTPNGGIRVVLDPFGIGHSWPSGAAQDRRAWVEVVAYKGGKVIYQSGVVADGASVDALTATDKDLWLLRDTMYDPQCNPVGMFWQAAHASGNELPPAKTFDNTNPDFYKSHVIRSFPKDGTPLLFVPGVGQVPDRVTFRLRIQPMGRDVLDDLIRSDDLDAGVADAMPTFDISLVGPSGPDAGPKGISQLEWTAEAAGGEGEPPSIPDSIDQSATCVGTEDFVAVPAYSPPIPDGCTP